MNRRERRAQASVNRGKPQDLTGVLICMPVFGQFNMSCATSTLYGMGQWLTKYGIPNQLIWYSASDIEEVRNLFLTVWYDTYPDYSHMFFWDSDMGCDPHVLRDMLRFNKPLTGMFYRRREEEVSVVGTAPEGHSIDDVVDGFLPSTGIGGGGMLISRKMVTEMLEKMPDLRSPIPSSIAERAPRGIDKMICGFNKIKTADRNLSEDMSFCQRWLDCGGEIWANVRYPISHVGPYNYQLCYELELKRNAFKKKLLDDCPKIEGESEESYSARLMARWEQMKQEHQEAA